MHLWLRRTSVQANQRSLKTKFLILLDTPTGLNFGLKMRVTLRGQNQSLPAKGYKTPRNKFWVINSSG